MLSYADFMEHHQWGEGEGEGEEGREEAREEVLGDSKECFKAVKTLVDHGMRIKSHLKDEEGKAGLRSLARVAVSNSVALLQAERALMAEEEGKEGGRRTRAKVGLTFVAHPQFPVLAVSVLE